MLSRYKSLYPFFAAPVFLVFLIWAHAVAPKHYNPLSQHVGDLGAQGYAHHLILRLGLLLFGGMMALGVLLNGIRGRTFPILIYSVCMIVAGIFSTTPWNEELNYSRFASTIHGMFVQLADWMLVAGIFIQGVHASRPEIRRVHYAFFAAALAITLGAWFLPEISGLLQRLLWALGLYWLVLHFRPRGL